MAWAGPLAGQTITHSAGQADLTFFYDSDNNTWDVVFRSKGGTVATGLTNQYPGPPGGLGGPGSGQADWEFTTLNIFVGQAPIINLDGTDFFVTPASGQNYQDATNAPDLGIRTRLREDDLTPPEQFEDFRMTLNLGNSTLPGDFALFRFELGDPVVLYNTADNDLVHDWPVWGHTHWHWGFTAEGEYSLAFDFQGLGGEYGPSSTDSVVLNFTVIPEPGILSLLGLGALGFLGLRRFRQGRQSRKA